METGTCDFLTILRVLVKGKVDFIVVGGVCAVFQGAPVHTFDLDILRSRTEPNLRRLLTKLQELGAYYRERKDRKLRPQLSPFGFTWPSASNHKLWPA